VNRVQGLASFARLDVAETRELSWALLDRVWARLAEWCVTALAFLGLHRVQDRAGSTGLFVTATGKRYGVVSECFRVRLTECFAAVLAFLGLHRVQDRAGSAGLFITILGKVDGFLVELVLVLLLCLAAFSVFINVFLSRQSVADASQMSLRSLARLFDHLHGHLGDCFVKESCLTALTPEVNTDDRLGGLL
jgi:hypothetical protein